MNIDKQGNTWIVVTKSLVCPSCSYTIEPAHYAWSKYLCPGCNKQLNNPKPANKSYI